MRPAAAKVEVAQPLLKPVTLYLNLTGNASPFNSVDRRRVQGFLTDIDYVDGSAVSRLKPFGIERDQYRAQPTRRMRRSRQSSDPR